MGRHKKLTPEQAKVLLAEMQSADPCRRFIHELAASTQKQILASKATYTLVSSSNQGGKTTTAVVDCAAVLRGVHPHKAWFGPISVLIIVPSRAQASGIWGKRLLDASDIRHVVTTPMGKSVDLAQLPLIPSNEIEQITWAYSPQGKYPGYCKLKNGSEFRIFLSGDPNGWKRVQGFPYDAIYRDEAVGNQSLGEELMPRLSAAQTSVQKGLRPWGGTVMWVATATLVNDEFEQFMDRCKKGVAGHQLFWIAPSENPAVSMEVRDSMRSTMSAEAASIRLDGFSGAMDEVVIFRHQLDKARHILQVPYEPKPEDNIWVAWDPGWDHPFGLVFAATTPDAPMQLKIWRAEFGRKMTLDAIANRIATVLDGRMAEAFVFDPAAKKTEHSRGMSLSGQMEQLLTQMGVKSYRGVLFGRNRYEDTLPHMMRYLDPDPEDRTVAPLIVLNPEVTDLEDDLNQSNGCGRVWEQLSKYRKREGATAAARGYNIHKHDDEAVDLLRYLASRSPVWCKRDPNYRRSHHVESAHLVTPGSQIRPAPALPSTPYEMHLAMSRARRPSRGSFTVSDF